MSRSSVIASHPEAGNVESRRVFVRCAEANTTDGARLLRRYDGGAVGGDERVGPVGVHVEVEPGDAGARLVVEIENPTQAPLLIGAVGAGFAWTGHGLGSFRFLRNGWQSWSFTGSLELADAGEPEFPSGPWLRGLHHTVGERPADRSGWSESELVTAVGSPSGGPVCVVGVEEQGRSFAVVYLRREGDALSLEVEWNLDVRLEPGERRRLEPLQVSLGRDASRLLERFAEGHGRSAGARVAHPFVSGWCSWYHFFHDVTESDVLRNLEALEGNRDVYPIDVVQIDDGYQHAIGDWLETNEKFPRGLAPLAADIRAAGFTPGLWTAPFCVVPESRLFARRRDWLLSGADGPFRGLVHPAWSASANVHVLDTSRPEVLSHLEGVFRELVAMGFTYLKLDFLYAAGMLANAADPGLARAERLRRGLEAVRAGAGDEAFLLGCGCPLGAAVGVVDGMRIGPDVAPHWFAEAGIPGIEETVPATRSAIRSTLARAWMHRRLWLNDPDCLMARSDETQLTRPERESLATAIGATGGMVLFSDDLPLLSDVDRALVTSTLERARAVDELGIPGRARVDTLLREEIAREVSVATPESDLFARFNPDEAATDLPVHGARLTERHRTSPLAVFCDFDGTFSVQDVGSTLAIRHASDRRPAVWARLQRGELQAWEFNLEILGGLELGAEQVEAFLRTVDLDPGARDLLAWCDERGVPFRILSDGFDWNLNHLQVIHGVRFAYSANRLWFDQGAWRIRAGAPNPSCGCGTGLCKRGRIEAYRAQAPRGTKIVHIGNGRVSDTCGAIAADVAFAKDSLAKHLAGLGEPFQAFETLHDVIPQLEALL